MSHVLALDVGSSAVRAGIYESGAVAVAEPVRDLYLGERDPDRLVAIVESVLTQVAEVADAVGVSCFGHSLLALGEDSRPLTPILGWRDAVGDAVERLRAKLDPAALHSRTGCHLHASYWPAKLAWLAKAEPETFRAARRFIGFSEYLVARLRGAGEVPISLSLASATGLLDVRELRWDEELLALLGVEAERLPRISDEPVGGWYPALLDGACSNLGVGALGPTRAALMVGTSAALRRIYETGQPAPRPGLFLYRLDERAVVEGGALSDGGNLYYWLERTLQPAEGSIAERPPAEHGLVFLPLLGGERSPGWRAAAGGAVTGLTFATTPLDLRQAALESIAYRFADVADLMPEVEEVIATGGPLHRDEDWLQVLADVLERPVALSTETEASLRGAAAWTLERLGEPAPPAPPVDRVVEPRPDRAPAYRAARERLRRLYDAVT
jgi:gluconokinase